jgi:hypothetical protein
MSDWQAFNVCYWHKADIDFDAEYVRFGAKRTSLIGWPMSANDPKRTLQKTACK